MKYVLSTVALFWSFAASGMAHTTTLTTLEEQALHQGVDWAYFFSPLASVSNILLILLTLLGLGTLYFAATRLEGVRTWLLEVRARLEGYHGALPILLRLLLAFSLLGGALEGSLFLPSVSANGLEFMQVLIGLGLLLGFVVRFCALATLGLFLWGSVHSPYLLGCLEVPVAAALLLCFGGGRLSADDVLGIERQHWLAAGQMYLSRFSPTVLRISLGITFIWLAVTEKFLNPHVTELIIQRYGLAFAIPVSEAMWVFAVGWIELALGAVLLFGIFTRTAAAVALGVLTLSFLFFFTQGVPPFHHISLFGALAVLLITGGGEFSLDHLKQAGFKGTLRPRMLTDHQ